MSNMHSDLCIKDKENHIDIGMCITTLEGILVCDKKKEGGGNNNCIISTISYVYLHNYLHLKITG